MTPCDIGAVEFAPVTVTLGLNQATFRAGETLRVALGMHNLGPTVTTDAYLGVLLPDGVTVFFVSSLAPLQSTSQHPLPPCGMKPTVLDGRKSSDIHARPLTR